MNIEQFYDVVDEVNIVKIAELISEINELIYNENEGFVSCFLSYGNSDKLKNDLSKLDDVLLKADPTRLPVVISISLLRTPFLVKDNLNNWKDFRDRAATHLDSIGRDSKKIFKGLY